MTNWYPNPQNELETRFQRLSDLHSIACLDCGESCFIGDRLADPGDVTTRDRLYRQLQQTAEALISDDQIYDLRHDAKQRKDKDTLHFCMLALEDNDPYARYECYLAYTL